MHKQLKTDLEGHLSKSQVAEALNILESDIITIYCGGENYWNAFTSVTYTSNEDK